MGFSIKQIFVLENELQIVYQKLLKYGNTKLFEVFYGSDWLKSSKKMNKNRLIAKN